MNKSSIIVLCMNPDCSTPDSRCMDSRTLRTHPSDCSRHYFSVQTITNTNWINLQDYPSDPLGISVNRKVKQAKRQFQKKSNPFITRMIQNIKQKIIFAIDTFSQKFSSIYPLTCLQDLYISTYSLQDISKYLKQGSSEQFISKMINSNFSKLRYGQLKLINEKLEIIQSTFDSMLSGIKTQLKQIVGLISVKKSKQEPSQSFRVQEGRLKQKIQLGILKSKFIGSTKISCKDGKITFPKQDNIGSFLPWIYTQRSFSTGVHELRITSLKYPSVMNCGFTVLQQHDIDTYPYHTFKSLFSKQGKGFISAVLNNNSLQPIQQYLPSSQSNHNQIQYTINEVSEVILRLQLNSKPRAIIRNVQKTCFYVGNLLEGKKYRMGVYGSGWAINITQLW